MTFSYNPINDKKYLAGDFIWRTYNISPSEVSKSQLKYEFLGMEKISTHATTKKDILRFANGKEKTLFLDFYSLSLDCILIYKNGNRRLARWDHVYKNDVIYIDGLPLSKIKTSDIERIVLIDDLKYHPDMLKYWTDRGFKTVIAMEELKQLLNKVMEEV